jgi:hypothetical protein
MLVMTRVEQKLREALAGFMRAASDKDSAAISKALTEVTEWQQKLGSDAAPMLRHYLKRRSYQKALDFLNSGRPETETPQCEK